MLKTIFCLLLVYKVTYSIQTENKTRFQDVNSSNYNDLLRASQLLSKRLNEVVLTELGTKLHISVPQHGNNENNQDIVDQISNKIELKISTSWSILNDMKSIIVNKSTTSFTHPCPLSSLKKPSFSSSSAYEKELIGTTFKFSKERLSLKWNKLTKDLRVTRQYFLAHNDFATDLNCALIPQSSLRHLYHQIFHPQRKHILLILDSGMSYFGLQKSITVIKEILNILQLNDKLSFKLIGDSEYFEFESDCSNTDYSHSGIASENNKRLLLEFLTHLNISSNSNIVKTTLPINNTETNNTMLIVLTDFDNEFKAVSHAQGLLTSQKVSAAAVVIIQNDKLTRSKKRENDKMNINNVNLNLMYFDNESIAAQVASRLIWLLSPSEAISDGEIIAATPYWDATQRDYLLPLLVPLKNQGLIGLDLYLSDIAEDIIYFKRLNPNERLFLMNNQQIIIFHSFFPRPEISPEKIKFSNLKFAENVNHLELLKEKLKMNISGMLKLPHNEGYLVYTWRWIKKMFVVCFVSDQLYNTESNFTENSLRNAREILYHRLDLFPPKNGKVCRHFKQLSTLEQGTVYLSPSSFSSPSSYLRDMNEGHDAAITYMQNYLAYLKGIAIQYLSNPGLKSEVRNDVNSLNPLLSYFKKQHFHGIYSSYIVRRYAVAESGVLVMFPGTVLEYEYEPVRRPWYAIAIENPGRICLTPPGLDVGGAGYIVTISYAIKLSPKQPYVVVAMDVTMGFLYKILIDSFPVCNDIKVKCFIMNNYGYLISHPGLMDQGPVEQQHITHQESLIVSDMLNHKGFVTKKLCNSFSDRTIQRFYEFNMSLPGVLSNVISGDHWVHYYVSAIPETNSFVGVVNATVTIFCPCNREGRLCLNCYRMEQNECECPCECNYNNCDEQVTLNQTENSTLCGPFQENNQHKSHYYYNYAENLQPCFESQCESYSTYSTCLGIMGCEWCQIDTDGKALLSSPFCTTQSSCFSGVLGEVTPYGEGTFGQVTAAESFSTYSAIGGPIAGCVVTVCLIVVVSIYCYKQNNSSTSCRDLYAEGPVDNWPDQDLQLSHLQSDDHGDNSGHDRLLPNSAHEAPISPYKILTGYRKPNTTGDSDHGYSTMTPHEDSEVMAFSMSEPITMLDDSNMSDVSASVSTRGRSKNNSKITDPTVTTLPCGKNSVIVPVTVHRNMEAS